MVRTVQIPINGPIDHNAGPQVAIGGLIIAWANNESVFLAMMHSLIDGSEDTASVIWHSHPNTRSRLELLDRLIRDRVTDQALVADIQRAIKNFRGQTRVRNFFCHAIYNYDPEKRLHSVTSMEVTRDGEPIKAETKLMGVATMNEITSATMELNRLNLVVWKLVIRLQAALGVQRVKLPELLLQTLREEGRPDPSEGEIQPEPPQPSEA